MSITGLNCTFYDFCLQYIQEETWMVCLDLKPKFHALAPNRNCLDMFHEQLPIS